jgi:hypothetical protein
MRHSPRFRVFLRFIPTLFLMLTWTPALAAENRAVFVIGGDVEWSLNDRPKTVRYHIVDPTPYGQLLDVRDQVIDDWPLIPYLNEGESKTYLESLDVEPGRAEARRIGRINLNLHFSSNEESLSYPLRQLAPTLRAADLVFFNLETPLSDTARMDGMNRTPEKFAATLRSVGASLVTVANNHSFDTQEQGFLDTLRALSSAGLPYIGGGHDLVEARTPVILERNGIKLGFIGYAQFSNMGEAAFAAEGRPGIAPMDPFLIKEDIRRLRPRVDYVVVSIHWATSKSSNVSPENRKFAHDLIDAGADLILGHHPPHPKGIEVYRGKVVIYSPSNVVKSHNYIEWGDNYLVRLTLGVKSVEKVEVLPIAGKGQQLFQPFLLQGSAAQQLLETIRGRSAELDTAMTIDGDNGIITIPPTSK